MNAGRALFKIGAMKFRRLSQGSIRRGFTVGELILALSAGGLLLAFFAPVYEKAKNMATLRATIADMHMWERAITDYVSDFGAAPTNPNGKINYKKPILRELLPYLERVKTTDLWGSSYWIWTQAGIDEYGIRTAGVQDFVIVSLGKKGLRENWTYDPRQPQAGHYLVSSSKDFEKDLVLWNGRFVRGPINP